MHDEVADNQGLILFGHGARDPRWAEPFEKVAARLRIMRPQVAVQLAFLEFLSPALPEAAQRLASAGARRITVVPMFLGLGGHVRKDLPSLLQSVQASLPQLRIELAPSIGEVAGVLDAMAAAAAGWLDETGGRR